MTRRLALAALAFCAYSRAAEPAEYLVTLTPGADQASVREVYGRFGIGSVKALGNDVYLVVIQRDPGLPAMAQAGAGRIQAVQRNQRYRRY